MTLAEWVEDDVMVGEDDGDVDATEIAELPALDAAAQDDKDKVSTFHL